MRMSDAQAMRVTRFCADRQLGFAEWVRRLIDRALEDNLVLRLRRENRRLRTAAKKAKSS